MVARADNVWAVIPPTIVILQGPVGKLARLPRHGIGLHVEAHGRGPGLLLTHGFGAISRMWDEQIEEFTDRHQLILWDLPGHGGSEAPGEATTQKNLVADMRAVLGTAKVSRAVLVGLGIGGVLSLRFWRAYPANVRGLVLIGTTPGLRSAPARALSNAHAELQAAALERDGLAALEGGAEADPRLHTDPAGLAAAARILLTQDDEGALPFLADIGVPALILVGGADKPNLTAAAYMERIMPNARAVVIPRANHAVNIHKPDVANAAIRDFLGRLPE
ncbi:MAG: alpha/beta fold hydrolase [Acetobacteraceae bacterium]|nr:alpha/beta fold hydrolase [Acetobacteraceae bacterium]